MECATVITLRVLKRCLARPPGAGLDAHSRYCISPASHLRHNVHSAERQPIRLTWVREAKTVLGFSLLYFFIDVALNAFAFADAWTIIWPLNGVNVALLLMNPRSRWPWMLLGIEMGTGAGELFDVNNPLMEVGQRICSATEVLISAC